MTATYTAEHDSANYKDIAVVWQPADAATAQLVDLGQPQGAGNLCVPVENFWRFKVRTLATLLVGAGVTVFKIYAATSAAGAGAVPVVAHAVGTAPDAEGDTLLLECNIEQIREVLPTATHIGVWLDCAHNDDETAVTLTCFEPRFAYAGLNGDYTAA